MQAPSAGKWLSRKASEPLTRLERLDGAPWHTALGILIGAALAFLLGGAALIQGNQGTKHPEGIWIPLALACILIGIGCLAVFVLLLAGRRKRPEFTINSGTGWEYEFSTRPMEGIDDLVATQYPNARLINIHTKRLRVSEGASVAAKDVSVRIAAAYPSLPEGVTSFPAYLPLHETLEQKGKDFAPADRDYVAIVHLGEFDNGCYSLTPAFLSLHDPITLEIEVLMEGKRADARYFSISGHMATTPDGRRIVSGKLPLVTEIPVFNATE